MMETYTVSKAKQELETVLQQASKDGKVRIKTRKGLSFLLTPELSNKSLLDVEGIDLGISASEIVKTIRHSREMHKSEK